MNNSGIKAAQTKRQAMFDAGIKQNRPSRRKAINAFCYECMGDGGNGPKITKQMIEDCQCEKCPLHAYIPMVHGGQGGRKTLIRPVREYCIMCVGGRDSEGWKAEILKCSFLKCALFPLRPSTREHTEREGERPTY